MLVFPLFGFRTFAEIRAISAFVFMKNPATIQSCCHDGAGKQERENSFEAVHGRSLFKYTKKKCVNILSNATVMGFVLFHC